MRVALFLGITFVLALTSIFAQTPPPVADNASPSDRSLKDRSIEMERIKREESKSVVTGKPGEALAETKFNEIKEDFERIQVAQREIVSAYQKTEKIDYKLIAASAEQIGKRGTRLSLNLFPDTQRKEDKKKDKKKISEPAREPRVVPSDIRTLIAEMDNTLALFVANAMFSNSRVVNAADHAKAKADLEHIIGMSAKLQELAIAAVGVAN